MLVHTGVKRHYAFLFSIPTLSQPVSYLIALHTPMPQYSNSIRNTSVALLTIIRRRLTQIDTGLKPGVDLPISGANLFASEFMATKEKGTAADTETKNVRACPSVMGNGTTYDISSERIDELVSSGNPVPQEPQAKLDYVKHATAVRHYDPIRRRGKCNKQ